MPNSRTPSKPLGAHCTVDELLNYLLEADEGGDPVVEAHVADCARCADLFGRLSQISLLVDNWNATFGSELSWKIAILKAFEEAPRHDQNRKFAQQLDRWAKSFSGRVQAVLGVRVLSPRDGSLSFSAQRKGMLASGGWEFVPAVMAGTGAIRIAGVRGAPEARVELRTTGASSHGGFATVAITLPPDLGAGIAGRLVLLVPQEHPELAKAQPLLRQSDGSCAAEFASLEAGSYLVVFEPREHAES